MTYRCAVVGLGLIGSEWAKHLNEDGVLGATWNRTPKSSFPKFESRLSEIPKRAEVIQMVVSDEKAAMSVGETLAPGLSGHHRLIQSTTIDPATSTKLKAMIEGTGARYLEAPFTGSLPAAQKRQTVFYLGGDTDLIEELMPYLRRLSFKQFVLGNNVQACTLKLAMNLQIASAMEALAEALTLCRRSGISDDAFFTAFRDNASFSGVAGLKEAKLKDSDFSPQFSVKHMAKDLRLLSSMPGEPFLLLKTVQSILRSAEEEGLGDEDFSAVIRLLR